MLKLTVAGDRQLRDMAQRLRRGKGVLRQELAAGLRKPTDEAVAAVRRAVMTADMRGFRRRGARKRFPPGVGDNTPLRRPVANAVEGKVTTSAQDPRATVTLRESRVPAAKRKLLLYLGGRRRRLRHPVMGNRSVWVSQRMPDIWHPTIRRRARSWRDAAEAAIDRTAERIEKG